MQFILIDRGPLRVFDANLVASNGDAELALLDPRQDASRAEEYFQRSLAVAHKHEAKSWELRAAMSLARLWRDQGQGAASARTACSGLRLVTEGFDTLDLKQAKVLLEVLAA